jgi:hypothetical protein
MCLMVISITREQHCSKILDQSFSNADKKSPGMSQGLAYPKPASTMLLPHYPRILKARTPDLGSGTAQNN